MALAQLGEMGMTKHTENTSFLKRFKHDTQGTMAVMWGVSLMAVVIAVGSAYDFNKISAARQQSIATADMLALTAAVYIRDHDGVRPTTNKEGFRNNRKYYLEDIGIDLAPYDDKEAVYRWRKGRNKDLEEPYFKIKYDYPEQGLVTAVIHGQTRPAFMGIVGVDNVDFSAASTVAYEVRDLKDPVSVGLVLDNSGSMSLDDGNGTVRMTGLKSTVKTFMGSMYSIYLELAQQDAERGENLNYENIYIRTNMMTYATKYNYGLDQYAEVITERPFEWSVIPDYKIEGMVADGGTNSSGAMALMNTRMLSEDQAHLDKTESEPLKYVVFMTDGVNAVTHRTNCRQEEGHYHWLHWDSWTIDEANRDDDWGWYKVWAREHDEWAMSWQPGTICDESSSYDAATINSCNQLKAQGADVYSIGYALAIQPTDSQHRRAEIARANALLSSCSSGDEFFHRADNASALDAVFDGIGKDIVEDTIRIRG